jgi:hypothetical protein
MENKTPTDNLRPDYQFNYEQAKPNRFAMRETGDGFHESLGDTTSSDPVAPHGNSTSVRYVRLIDIHARVVSLMILLGLTVWFVATSYDSPSGFGVCSNSSFYARGPVHECFIASLSRRSLWGMVVATPAPRMSYDKLRRDTQQTHGYVHGLTLSDTVWAKWVYPESQMDHAGMSDLEYTLWWLLSTVLLMVLLKINILRLHELYQRRRVQRRYVNYSQLLTPNS